MELLFTTLGVDLHLARRRIITHGTLAGGHQCLYRKWGWLCKPPPPPPTQWNTFQNPLSQQEWGVYLWVCKKLSTSTRVTVQKKKKKPYHNALSSWLKILPSKFLLWLLTPSVYSRGRGTDDITSWRFPCGGTGCVCVFFCFLFFFTIPGV